MPISTLNKNAFFPKNIGMKYISNLCMNDMIHSSFSIWGCVLEGCFENANYPTVVFPLAISCFTGLSLFVGMMLNYNIAEFTRMYCV